MVGAAHKCFKVFPVFTASSMYKEVCEIVAGSFVLTGSPYAELLSQTQVTPSMITWICQEIRDIKRGAHDSITTRTQQASKTRNFA